MLRACAAGLLIVVWGCTGFTNPTVNESATTVADADTDSASTSTSSLESSTTIVDVSLPDAPWSGGFIAAEDVDDVLLDAWSEASNRGYCALLAPADLGPEGDEAVARMAGFSPESDWFVAWDNPDGPGMTGGSETCEDCGRSAFGIHGSVLLIDDLKPDPGWADGSSMTVHLQEARYEDGHQQALANLSVAGQPCFYQVWSSLGEDHLYWFVDQLRFVDGYYSEPVEAGVVETFHTLGATPWAAPALSSSGVDALLLERWEESPASQECPLLTLADLGEDSDQASIRAANFGSWGVAWDNPSGPGHDGTTEPCSDCGRGVMGLSGGRGGPQVRSEARPNHVEWDDGSTAAYGYEGLLQNMLPPDRIDMRDPNTGEPTAPPIHAWVETADHPQCVYEIWTHLGEQHLLHLFSQLRYVNGYP